MLRMVLAQRLVRKICPHCKEPMQPTGVIRKAIEDEAGECKELFHGPGCARCRGTGYSGRVGIFELFSPGEAVLEKVVTGGSLQELRRSAAQDGHKGLRADGLRKVALGLTTYEEIIRVCAA
jgi:type II secretory ATPase GspE/PulE/Tfp pilus assembly ATPase PilB-like protein